MKRRLPIELILVAALFLAPVKFSARAQEVTPSATNGLNRFRFAPVAAFNITATFGSIGNLGFQPAPRFTPDGALYNYDNGYVLPDISGNAGGQTWNWGYDNSSQISGNTILMTRTTSSASTAADVGQLYHDVNYGFDFVYGREFGALDEVHYGLEAAGSYLYVCLRNDTSSSGSVTQATDAYPFTPGTTPPAAPPPYQGTFNGPGFVIGATPVSSTSVVTPGVASIMGHHEVTSQVIGVRVGPWVQVPMAEQVNLYFSGGLAVAMLATSSKWTENVTITGVGTTTTSGSGSSVDFVYGGYVGANLSWQISRRWSVEASAQYQTLGTSESTASGRTVDLDLGHSIIVGLGVGYRF